MPQRLLKFRKLPRGWKLFFNHGGYRNVITTAKSLQNECYSVIVSLAYDAAAFAEFRRRHTLIMNELDNLFLDTLNSIVNADHFTNSYQTVQNLLVENDTGCFLDESENVRTAVNSLQFSMERSHLHNYCVEDDLRRQAILLIDAVFRRFLVALTQMCVRNEDSSRDGSQHENQIDLEISNIHSLDILDKNDASDTSDIELGDGIFSSFTPEPTVSDDSTEHAQHHIYRAQSASRSSSDSRNSGLLSPSDDNKTHTSSVDDSQNLETFFSFMSTDDIECQDISILLSNMIDSVCNLWIDVPPSQTSQISFQNGKDVDETYTFQYGLPMVTSSVEYRALKNCSWSFYMCVTFYTRIDLVRISAVQCNHELPLLSLTWNEFSSICFPCESGVRVCLRFQGSFSSLIICQSRYNEIIKIRKVHAARQVANLARENRVRDCNMLCTKQTAGSICTDNSNQFPGKESRPSSQLNHILPHRRQVPPLRAKVSTISQLREKGLLSSTRMPFLNVVQLLQSAILLHRSTAALSIPALPDLIPSADHFFCNHSGTASNLLHPHPPKVDKSLSSSVKTIHSQRISRVICQPRISCTIPQVQLSRECDFPHDSNHGACPASSEPLSNMEPCGLLKISESPEHLAHTVSDTPRLLDSRGSLSFRLPSAEKSDTISMMVTFTPQPPSILPKKFLSPRVVAQRQLISEIPLTTHSPRQYVPQKLVARGRFKSTSVLLVQTPQHQASHVTLSLYGTHSRGVLASSHPDSRNQDDAESQTLLFNTPWRSTRNHSRG